MLVLQCRKCEPYAYLEIPFDIKINIKSFYERGKYKNKTKTRFV